MEKAHARNSVSGLSPSFLPVRGEIRGEKVTGSVGFFTSPIDSLVRNIGEPIRRIFSKSNPMSGSEHWRTHSWNFF